MAPEDVHAGMSSNMLVVANTNSLISSGLELLFLMRNIVRTWTNLLLQFFHQIYF